MVVGSSAGEPLTPVASGYKKAITALFPAVLLQLSSLLPQQLIFDQLTFSMSRLLSTGFLGVRAAISHFQQGKKSPRCGEQL